jgi:hypothetical protein
MNDYPIFCSAVTYRATRETPQELCENEVADYGDMCEKHDEEDRADAAYEDYRERERYGD